MRKSDMTPHSARHMTSTLLTHSLRINRMGKKVMGSKVTLLFMHIHTPTWSLPRQTTCMPSTIWLETSSSLYNQRIQVTFFWQRITIEHTRSPSSTPVRETIFTRNYGPPLPTDMCRIGFSRRMNASGPIRDWKVSLGLRELCVLETSWKLGREKIHTTHWSGLSSMQDGVGLVWVHECILTTF